ncbi:MAG TPA: DUF459 domain-containing protein [Hyphomicrobiaceae bacterium]|nr:DUF459 domain-containing protein [Hyphomicrobiaceae bacterium]
MRGFLAALIMVVALAAVLPAGPSAAQVEPSGTSYITPFPEGDVYKLQAYGDPFADGLLAGLNESFAGDTRLQLSRKHRSLNGIARNDFDDEMRAEENNAEKVHIGVVMIGFWDRMHMRLSPRDRVVFGTSEWREEYGKRVDRMIKLLKRKHIAVYWVGLPIMRRYEINEAALAINDIVREKAYLNGIKFIDIQAHFADEAGNYAPYGPDVTGKQRLLREADGALFTPAGNRKLALYVEQEIKRDLNQARNERAIPLAGSEAEQKRVAALRPRPAGDAGAWKGTVAVAGDGKGAASKAPASARDAPVADTSNDQKADNGRITLKSIAPGGREESVTIDIPRPAIPSAVIALLTRKESSDRPSQMGDVVADDVGDGLVVLSSITPAAAVASGPARRLAPSLSPYYQVLIKGDRVAAKPGRADDFSWPRPEIEVAPEPAAPAVRRPPRSPRIGSPRS